ncbi:hypothetical protein DRP05_08270 [Archaeoglobales archaeon]|nr:MAG: hypothetical protein DRP05_08270 [Archaeoglobales archaeon]
MEKINRENKENKVILTKKDIKALSSDIRIGILKKLYSSSKTLRKLSDELNMPKSTVHENLTVLVETGFVRKINKGNKWVYYELTKKGKDILQPHSKKRIVLLISSIISYIGSIVELYLYALSLHHEKV